MQTVNLTGKKASFSILGPDAGPPKIPGVRVTAARRKAYWEMLARHVTARKNWSLARGIDAHGKRLKPVRPSACPDRATGPPLTPHRVDSRSRKWLRVQPFPRNNPDRIVGFWSHNWATIVGYHARGEVRGAPIRDIVGLSARDQAWCIATARKEWAAKYPPASPAAARVGVNRRPVTPGRRQRPAARP